MSPNPWSDEYMNSMRQVGDPEADRAVQALYDEAKDRAGGLKSLNDLLFALTFEREFQAARLPGPVRAFAMESARLPDWLDEPLVRKGQDFFYRNGLGATVLLVCASLPECYVMKNGIHVLGLTTYLKDRPALRILETSQMVRDAMLPGGLAPEGKGILAIQKVRLLHAAIRHLILTTAADGHDMGRVYGSARWDPAWGHPICQEDLAYTLQTFAWVVVRGLTDMGADIAPDEAEAYIHCWNVVGHILGIQRDLIPEPMPGEKGPSRVERAKLFYQTIRRRQEGRTEDGVAIAGALVGFAEKLIQSHVDSHFPLSLFGGRELLHLPRLIMRDLLGESTMDMLGVTTPDRSGWQRLMRRLGMGLLGVFYGGLQRLSDGRLLGRMSETVHEILTRELSKLPPGYKQTFLPETLRRPADAPDPIDA